MNPNARPSLILPTSYTEAHFDGYHAAPLLIAGSEIQQHLVERQDVISHNLSGAAREMYEGSLKESALDLITRSIAGRIAVRSVLNSMDYSNREYVEPRFDLVPELSQEEIYAAVNRSRLGDGSIADNALTGRVFDINAELGNITTLGDFRKDSRTEMYKEVSEYLGEEVKEIDDVDYDSINILELDRYVADNTQHIGAMRLEMRRHLPLDRYGARIKVRRFAIVDTSPSSGFSEDTADRIIHAKRLNQPLSQKALKWLIEREKPVWRVLAANDTVYRPKPKSLS